MNQKIMSLPPNEIEWLFPGSCMSSLSSEDEKRSIVIGEELYVAYYTRIHRYFAFRIFDKEEAADLAQTVFLKIFRSLRSGLWTGGGGISYIFTVAKNTLIDYFRLKRHTSIVSNELVSIFEDTVSTAEHEKNYDHQEIIKEALQGLRADEAEAISLRYLSDMEYSAIALTMKKKECTVRQLVHRGLKLLRVNAELQLL